MDQVPVFPLPSESCKSHVVERENELGSRMLPLEWKHKPECTYTLTHTHTSRITNQSNAIYC